MAKKILFLTDNFPPEPNAAASRVYERACYWSQWGYDVTVLTSVPNKPEGRVYEGFKNKWFQKEMVKGIRVIRVKTFVAANEGFVLRTLDFLSYMLSALFFGLFLSRPHVVVATSPQFFAGVAGWFLSFAYWCPFIFEVADLWPESIESVGLMKKENFVFRLLEQLELFLYRRARSVILLSPAFVDRLTSRGIPTEKIRVILNGVDREMFHPRSKNKELLEKCGLNDKFVVGYIGTISIAHSVQTIIEAAEKLKSYDHIRFLIVGSGPCLEEIKKMVLEKQLKSVVLTGRQPKGSMPHFWSLVDVSLVHLSDIPVLKTPIPSKIFESMGMGKPIILGVPVGGPSRDIVEKSGAGLVISPEDPEEMGQAILKLASDRELYKKLQTQSLNSALSFSREHQSEQVIEVCERASGNISTQVLKPIETEKSQHIMSIDVEDWFHILDLKNGPTKEQWRDLEPRVEKNFMHLLDMMEWTQVKATLFFLGWIGESYPHLVKEAFRRGHEIASHGYDHSLVYEQTPQEFKQDIIKSKKLLEDLISHPVKGYRAPGFSLTSSSLWAFEEVIQAGYHYDSSLFPATRGHGGDDSALTSIHKIKTASGEILEVPISVSQLLGRKICFFGGGYFRFFPYSLIQKKIHEVEQFNQHVLFYLHPRDIDPDQPRIKMSPFRSFKSYVALAGTEEKLWALFRDYRWTSIQKGLLQKVEKLKTAS